jgi:Zn finger protein HypA/HybF involved in hydrogenase expression
VPRHEIKQSHPICLGRDTMTRDHKGRMVLYCESCRRQFIVPKDFDMRCPLCDSVILLRRCNRCGYTWRPRDPTRIQKACPNCRSPYYCYTRIVDDAKGGGE